IFAGRVALSSERAGTLIAWARQEEGETPTDPGFSSFDLSADLAVTQDGITLDRIRGDIADAPVTGDIGLVRMPDARELRIDLDAGVLSADLVTGIAGLIARDGRGNGEVPTRLVAEVTAQRLTVGGFDLGEVDAALTFERDRLDLRQLVIGNVGGARLAAEGQLETLTTAPAGTIRAGLDADEVGGLLTLAGRLFPQSELVADLRRNAPLYAPARLSLHYDGAVDDGAARMLLEGDVSGSVLSFAAERTGGAASDPAASSLTARLSVEGESAFRLLSQAGLALFPTGVDTPGTLVLSLDGVPREGLETALSFEGLGGRFSYDGTVLLDGGAPQLSGALSFRHDDVGPLGLMAGISLPILPGGLPVTLAGDVSGTFDALSLSRIDARILDARATGYLERRRPASGPSAISGQLALDGIDLELLALALFGPEALDPVAGTRLPGGLFSPLLLDDESVGVHITAPRARLADDSVLTGFAADLHLGAEGVALDAIEAGFAGGRVTGRLSVDMADLTPVLSARLALEGVDAAALSWQDGARAVIGGRLSAQVSLDGQGRSIAALAAALSGEGAFQLEDGRIEGLSPSAFARIVRASEAGLVEEDPQVNAAFAGQLASGGLDLPHLEGPLTIAGGTLRAASLGVETPEVALRGTLEVDLAEMDLSAGIQMTPRGAVSGLTLPGVALSFAGPVEAPERRLDTQQLTAALGVQRLEVEIERVEALNAEILERERLVRELSVIRAARQRIEAERQAEDAARQREAARQEEER
ncbi:MAG: hypothetical protein KDI98_04380, partial [Hyphomicrobiaceae bacterium]|nr:hypothetical protein [Hyphomicrobiaceae bacterium]